MKQFFLHLGYSSNKYNKVFIHGFKPPKHNTRKRIVKDTGEAHLITIAPTGAGKGRAAIIPTAIEYRGSMIIIDPKGECYRVTSDIRRKNGNVYVLDPFNIVTENTDRFNPLDIAKLNDKIEAQASMIASALQNQETLASDPFWDNKSRELITALLIVAISNGEGFKQFRKRFFAADVDYDLAVLLDSKTITSDLARELIEAYLSLPSDKTRPCVLTTAQQHISVLGDPAVLKCLDSPTSFNLQDALEGKPVTIYLVIPPNKLKAYAALLRLWVTCFLFLFTERKARPRLPTLFVLDETANLGKLDALVSAVTLLRSYGLRVWTFFQDLGQIKTLYPHNWTTIINNCDVLQAFGMRNFLMAEEVSKLFGDITSKELLFLPQDECIVARTGHHTERLTKLDYLNDKRYKKYQFNPNPFYRKNNRRISK